MKTLLQWLRDDGVAITSLEENTIMNRLLNMKASYSYYQSFKQKSHIITRFQSIRENQQYRGEGI